MFDMPRYDELLKALKKDPKSKSFEFGFDLIFSVRGDTIPHDHAYPLYGALSGIVPAIHNREQAPKRQRRRVTHRCHSSWWLRSRSKRDTRTRSVGPGKCGGYGQTTSASSGR